MKFIVILIALAFERGLHLGDFLYRFNWFGSYLASLRGVFSATSLWQGFPGVILAVLPLLIIVALFYYLFGWIFFGLVGAIISIFVLLYCLGPNDLYTALDRYFVGQIKDDPEADKHLESILHNQTPGVVQTPRAVTQGIFVAFNENIFAVLFWFCILGPLGAVLYRSIALIRKHAEQPGSEDAALLTSATWLQEVLDWVPVRLLGLGFVLAGNFMNSFSYWVKNLLTGLTENVKFLVQTGLLALQIKDEDAGLANVEENKAALGLTDRALIVYIIIIAVFVLGAVLY